MLSDKISEKTRNGLTRLASVMPVFSVDLLEKENVTYSQVLDELLELGIFVHVDGDGGMYSCVDENGNRLADMSYWTQTGYYPVIDIMERPYLSKMVLNDADTEQTFEGALDRGIEMALDCLWWEYRNVDRWNINTGECVIEKPKHVEITPDLKEKIAKDLRVKKDKEGNTTVYYGDFPISTI